MLQVVLFNDSLGTLRIDDVDPKGLSELENEIKRGDDNDGVIYEISLNLEYSKKARRFIQLCYETQGIETVILANTYLLNPNNRRLEIYTTNQLRISNYEISETKLRTSSDQIGFQVKFVNLSETDVDLETTTSQNGLAIPVTPTIETTLHAKKILKKSLQSPVDGNEFAQNVFSFTLIPIPFPLSRDVYVDIISAGQIDTSDQEGELTTMFQIPYGWSTFPIGIGLINNEISPGAPGSPAAYIAFLTASKTDRNPVHKADSASNSELKARLTLKHSVYATNPGGGVDICGEGCLGNVEVMAFFEQRDKNDNIKFIEHVGSWYMVGCGGEDRIGSFEVKNYSRPGTVVEVGDFFYCYTTTRIYGTYKSPATPASSSTVSHQFRIEADVDMNVDGLPNTYIQFASQTIFPETTAKGILIHESGVKLAQYMTDQVDCFHSDFLGRIDSAPVYAQDGEGSLMMITNGGNIRKLAKQIFANWKDWFNALNSIWCLGWGFETVNGVQKVRVEKKDHFYNKNSMILDLGPVDGIKKIVDMRYYFAQFEIGYPKIEAQQVNGIDEVNTVRRFKFPLTQAKTKLQIRSQYRTGAYEIEAQRRLQDETKDSKVDDDNFLIMMKRSGGGFLPQKNEQFSSSSGIYDFENIYNAFITPTRNARRWVKVWAACILRQINKVLTFTYGEINYTASTQLTTEGAPVFENGLINLAGVEPIWHPERYEFEHRLRAEEFQLIRQNPYGFIRFRDNLNIVHEGYILSVIHKVEAKKGVFKLLRVYRTT